MTGLPVVCPDGKVLLRVTDYKGTGIVRLNENNIALDLRTRFDSAQASFAVQPDFVLFPNPATQTLHITTPFKITAVSVYNSLGQKIIACENLPDSNQSIFLTWPKATIGCE